MVAGIVVAALALDATAEQGGDVRGFRIGMSLGELPTAGYTGHACATNGERSDVDLSGWQDFRRCPKNTQGLREVRFEYAPPRETVTQFSRRWQGTKVAGHRVWMSLLLDQSGTLQGIRYRTDPTASEFFRKKAYLLGQRVQRHYHQIDWQCAPATSGEHRLPVGGVLVDEQCRGALPDRVITVQSELYRKPGQDLEEFVNATRVEVLSNDLAPPSQ